MTMLNVFVRNGQVFTTIPLHLLGEDVEVGDPVGLRKDGQVVMAGQVVMVGCTTALVQLDADVQVVGSVN